MPPREFEPVAEAFVEPVRGKAARGLERQDARQGAIIGETHRLQPMVEGAGAEVAAQPFGNARPERGGIAAHRPLSRILPIAMSALPHLVRSEEHTSELQSLMRHSYAVFLLTKKKSTTR